MRFLTLALFGAAFALGLTGFAPNMPTIHPPFGGGGGGNPAVNRSPSIVFNLSTGVTDIGRFTRVFVAGN